MILFFQMVFMVQMQQKESFRVEQLKPELNKQVEHVSLSLHF